MNNVFASHFHLEKKLQIFVATVKTFRDYNEKLLGIYCEIQPLGRIINKLHNPRSIREELNHNSFSTSSFLRGKEVRICCWSISATPSAPAQLGYRNGCVPRIQPFSSLVCCFGEGASGHITSASSCISGPRSG